MIPSNPIPAVCNYASSAAYCSCPSDAQVANGVVPLDSLPAAWWNWMWAKTNEAVNCARGAAGALITEINNVLTQAGVCSNPSCTDQLYQAINKIRQTIGNGMTAGAVKSSSCPSEVSIDSYGYMSVNCLGNAANLTTSATTIVGAINELKCTYDSCISSINTNITNLQNCKAPTAHASTGTTYGVGSSSCYGHLKISDTYASLLSSCSGVAASQKALYCAYYCLSNMPTAYAECACCIYVNNTASTTYDNFYPLYSDQCCAGFMKVTRGSSSDPYYTKSTNTFYVPGGADIGYFIQKKGMLNLNSLPTCIEVCNKWKVCAFTEGNGMTFCNYGTEFVIVNYGNLVTCCACDTRIIPAIPLNVILSPGECVSTMMPTSWFYNRPAAVLTI